MLKTKLTRRIHEKITRVFEKLARTTVNRKYTKSTNKFSQLFTNFDEINKKILSQDPNKMIKIGDIEKTASERLQTQLRHIQEVRDEEIEQGAFDHDGDAGDRCFGLRRDG